MTNQPPATAGRSSTVEPSLSPCRRQEPHVLAVDEDVQEGRDVATREHALSERRELRGQSVEGGPDGRCIDCDGAVSGRLCT